MYSKNKNSACFSLSYSLENVRMLVELNEKGYLRNMCDKTRRDGVSNKFIQRLNTDYYQYKKSV